VLHAAIFALWVIAQKQHGAKTTVAANNDLLRQWPVFN